MFKILVVEDDKDLNRAVRSYLNMNHYNAVGCTSVKEAYDAMNSNKFDLIISDIMMPDIDGIEFARSVRETNKEIPIIFMTARDDIFSKQKGFSAGIDDYMVKPIDLDEMMMRISAIMRRAKINSSREIEVGDVVINVDERIARIKDCEVALSAREFNIIYKLLSYPKKTITSGQLMEEFWDANSTSGLRTVDVYMAKLREKFSSTDAFEIVTVHGLGYKAVIKE